MYKKIILFLGINLLGIGNVFALPIGLLILTSEGIILIISSITAIILSFFIYVKKINYLLKTLFTLLFILFISIVYFWTTHQTYIKDENETIQNKEYKLP